MSVHAKATRLVRDGAVRPVEQARTYRVQGDTAEYLVTVWPYDTGYDASCPCPATTTCSHELAALEVAQQA